MVKSHRILSLLVTSAFILTANSSAWATSDNRPTAKRPLYKKIGTKIGTKIKNQVSLVKMGFKGLPTELKAAWQFQRAIRSNPLLRKAYRAEKRNRHTGLGKFATWSSWAAFTTNMTAIAVLPGTQPFHALATGFFGATFFQYNLKVGRDLDAARVDTVRYALRNNQKVDKKILAHYGQFLIGAAKKDLTVAKADLNNAKTKVQSSRDTYQQQKLEVKGAPNFISRWLSTNKKINKLDKLNKAKDSRRDARQQVNELTAELGQLTPQFSSK